MSTMNRTLVIGATGNIGREVVLHLAANDHPVRALTRKPDEICMPPHVGAGLPAFVASTVAEITGAPARTFYDWATDHAADFRRPRDEGQQL